jgi:DNA-binding GntR family transcriptional regulator
VSVIVRNQPLHIQVYNAVKRDLLKGSYSPGEKLTELYLAKELGVSRGPVREAIRMLIQDGLLIHAGTHVHVFKPTSKTIVDLYVCRESLEGLAARFAAENYASEKESAFNENIKQTRQALVQEDKESIVQLNTEFHDLILKFSQNNELSNLMSTIRDKILYMRNTLFNNLLRSSSFIEEHEEIAKAIVAGNGELAEQLMKQHIGRDLKSFDHFFLENEQHD